MKRLAVMLLLLTFLTFAQQVHAKVIGFLPLDCRPCNYDVPVKLAKIFGAEIIYPTIGYSCIFPQ